MWNKTQQKLRAWLEYNDNIIGLLSTFVDDKILIDVGANRGQIYRQWASLNPNTNSGFIFSKIVPKDLIISSSLSQTIVKYSG